MSRLGKSVTHAAIAMSTEGIAQKGHHNYLALSLADFDGPWYCIWCKLDEILVNGGMLRLSHGRGDFQKVSIIITCEETQNMCALFGKHLSHKHFVQLQTIQLKMFFLFMKRFEQLANFATNTWMPKDANVTNNRSWINTDPRMSTQIRIVCSWCVQCSPGQHRSLCPLTESMPVLLAM